MALEPSETKPMPAPPAPFASKGHPASWLMAGIFLFPGSPLCGQVTFSESRAISDFTWQVDTVMVHDADRDGDLDLFAIPDDFQRRAAWWINDGEGRFQPGKISGLSDRDGAGIRDHFAIDDFDGNGTLDLLFSDQRSLSAGDRLLQVFLVSGSADEAFAFNAPELVAEVPIGDASPSVIQTADLNQDGHPDLIAEDFLILSRGPLQFQEASLLPPFVRDLQRDRFFIGNLDADPELEIVPWNIRESDPEIIILDLSPSGEVVSKPQGTFLSGHRVDDLTTLPGAPGAEGAPLLLVKHERQEFNPDDPLQVTSSHHYLVYRPDHAGRYHPDSGSALVPEDGAEYGLAFFHLTDREDLFLRTTTIDDDLITTGKIYRLLWDGEVLARELVFASPATFHRVDPFLADLNGDELEDLVLPGSSLPRVLSSAYDQLQWAEAKAGGGFSTDLNPINDRQGGANLGHVGDLDADGDIDLVSEFSESFDRHLLRIWRNDGLGNFDQLIVPFPTGRRNFQPGDYCTTSLIAARDLSGTLPFVDWVDRTLSLPPDLIDFLVRVDFPASRESIIGWVVQESAGVFRFFEVGQDPLYGSGGTTDLFLDWDGDGEEDLVVIANPFSETQQPGQSQNYRLSWISNPIFASIHHQTILPSVPGLLSFGFQQAPQIALLDMDRDGDLDVFSSGDLLGQTSSYWFERGPGQDFVAVNQLDEALWPLGLDFDGDGYEDFGTGHDRSTNPQSFVSLSRPGVAFETTSFDLNISFQATKNLLDLDGDGDRDLLSNISPSRIALVEVITWHENVGNRFTPFDQGIPVTGEPRIGNRAEMALADLDGDGIQDLVVASSGSVLHLEWFRGGRASSPPASFESWMGARQLTGHSAAALSDHDGDGSSNWHEFLIGSDPGRPDPDSPGRLATTAEGNSVLLTFRQRTGYQLPIESSDDLKHWEPLPDPPDVRPDLENYQQMRYHLDRDEDRHFYRLLIEPPPR